VIDLHLHTTASDGRLAPADLVAAAHAAGIGTMAVTDHDTVAGVPAAIAAGVAAGVTVIPGIEITAVRDGRDVHVLGYFLETESPELAAFLTRQRADRRRRIVEIAARLNELGVPVALTGLESRSSEQSGESIGRPVIAAALVAAGHVATIAEAFDRYLGEGQAAFVPRTGASPAEVVALIARAGGCAAIAHPGKLKDTDVDAFLEGLAADGMPALEVHHPDHDEAAVERFGRLATRLNLIATGGSDFHGPDSGRANALGRVGMSADDFARLAARFDRQDRP
jgi:hypothetical protein